MTNMTNTFDRTNSFKNIQTLRSVMINCGIANGLNHPTTIKLSQNLDKLLNECLITDSSAITFHL